MEIPSHLSVPPDVALQKARISYLKRILLLGKRHLRFLVARILRNVVSVEFLVSAKEPRLGAKFRIMLKQKVRPRYDARLPTPR